jgi:small-conductance mechanosensitive channel
VAVRWDGQVVYFANSALSQAPIVNVRRSRTLTESVSLFADASTETEALWQLRDEMAQFVKENPSDFTDQLALSGLQIIEDSKLKVSFSVQHKHNFQNDVDYYERRTRFMAALRESCLRLGIK